ncbi:hypothetical protein EU545_00565 [Candidatus Thorarchaeota archaeon]|nr:MAG: hypothetical protein EU545_00565 [Candidatus Thorarchaeota archaeon]
MTRKWLAIAKAEYYVLTSFMRARRTLYMGVILTLSLVWAVVVAPMLMGAILTSLFPMDFITGLLRVVFPGMMRSLMLFLWLILLMFPLSQALQEIKIGHWEIFISNNVSTRNIISGTFLGKIPVYGIIVILLAPLLISPFMLAFEVSVFGQLLVYGVLALLSMSTIWLSNLITAVIQARLGDSSRGNDIAKALSMIVAIVVVVPMYGLMFFLPSLSEMMGMNAMNIIPSTWFADLVTWSAIAFNGIGVTASEFASVLQFSSIVDGILTGLFVAGTVALGVMAADRIFTIEAGSRTEVVTTVTRENPLLGGIRRVSPGAFGALVVTSFKDFTRKAQNLSKIGYGLILAIMLPVIMTTLDVEYVQLQEMFIMLVVMMSLVGTFPFAGTGFLESKDQLWIIQGAPSGATRFVRSRVVSQAIICVPLAILPTIALYFIMGLSLAEAIMVLGYGFMAILGGMFIATGITARNPNYEDTKSPAHQANIMLSVLLAEFSIMGVLFIDMFTTIALGIDFFGLVAGIVGSANVMYGMTLVGLLVQWSIGAILLFTGVRNLSKPGA